MPSADWYFDFISPFAYLQSEQIARGALPRTLRIHYKPILFAGLLGHWGHRGPAEIPAKRRFTYEFAQWQAKRLEIPLRFPPQHPFNPLPLLRLALVAECMAEAITTIFRFVWRDGRLGDLPIEWAELEQQLGIADTLNRISAPEIKQALQHNTDEAVSRGIFGVPTLMIGEQLFWGSGATEMAADFVTQGCHFSDPEFARVAALPVGAERTQKAEKRRS